MLATRNAHLGLGNNTLLLHPVDRRSSKPHGRLGGMPLPVLFFGITRPCHQEPPENTLVLGLRLPPLFIEEAQSPHRLDPDLVINEPLLVPPR